MCPCGPDLYRQDEISRPGPPLARRISVHPKHPSRGRRGAERRPVLSSGPVFSPGLASSPSFLFVRLFVCLRNLEKELKSSMCNCRSEAKGTCRPPSLPVLNDLRLLRGCLQVRTHICWSGPVCHLENDFEGPFRVRRPPPRPAPWPCSLPDVPRAPG